MPRFTDRSQVTRDELLAHAKQLRGMATQYELIADLMKKAGITDIDPTHAKTAADGMVSLGKFLGAAFNSYCDMANLEEPGPKEIADEISRLTGRPSVSALRAARTVADDRDRRRERKKTKTP